MEVLGRLAEQAVEVQAYIAEQAARLLYEVELPRAGTIIVLDARRLAEGAPLLVREALRLVWQVARNVKTPVIGIGGIATIDDVMEFLVAGASAVQIGTANFYDPTVSTRIVDQLPQALQQLGAKSVKEVIGTLNAKG